MTFPADAHRVSRLVPPLASCVVAGLLACAQGGRGALPPPSNGDGPSLPPEVKKNTVPPQARLAGDMYIREYRVRGSHLLNGVEIGNAVYPFLGPGRTAEDIENARAALEKAFQDKGYSTVRVSVPQLNASNRGIVFLDVEELVVGKLLVKGARYTLPEDIKKKMPSLTPGNVPNSNDLTKEFVALSRSKPGLELGSPIITPGQDPGTVDVEFNVKDKAPLHGSLELNNRYSPNTVPLRLNGSVSYDNLWQISHSLGFSFQIAPERMRDGQVYSAFYTVPLATDVSFTVSGTRQNSDVASLTGADTLGRGNIMGAHVNWTLPQSEVLIHSLSLGMDYKHMLESTRQESLVISDTPIDYYPLNLGYAASWVEKKSFTELNANVNMHFRGMGSDEQKFDDKRFNADGSYVYFRGDLTHTHDLPGGMNVMAKVQGQLSNHPLVNSEQFAGGGQSTVRGYLESTALGDDGVFGTLELRSPSFIGTKKEGERSQDNEWRVYAFVEGGTLMLHDALPEQKKQFDLASVGFGTHLKLREHFNGSLDVSFPLIDQGSTLSGDVFLSFRVWADF